MIDNCMRFDSYGIYSDGCNVILWGMCNSDKTRNLHKLMYFDDSQDGMNKAIDIGYVLSGEGVKPLYYRGYKLT